MPKSKKRLANPFVVTRNSRELVHTCAASEPRSYWRELTHEWWEGRMGETQRVGIVRQTSAAAHEVVRDMPLYWLATVFRVRRYRLVRG